MTSFRPTSSNCGTTRIPILESKVQSRRKRHVNAEIKNQDEIKKSEPEMDSSFGILSPSDMKASGIMAMTASQASNQGNKVRNSKLSLVLIKISQ